MAANQQTLASLQTRVGELISNDVIPKTDIRRNPAIAQGVHISMRTLKDGPESNKEFLKCIGVLLNSTVISVSDAFRRKFVFSTLESLFARVPPDQGETLKGLLLAQLHDEAVRSLILQALADQDDVLLKTYANLGLNVAVLNEFQNDLCPELARRFQFRNQRL